MTWHGHKFCDVQYIAVKQLYAKVTYIFDK